MPVPYCNDDTQLTTAETMPSLLDKLAVTARLVYDEPYMFNDDHGSRSYTGFSPLWYLQDKPIVDDTMIADLKSGATMLSVGAGQGRLETFLTDALGLSNEQITCADKQAEGLNDTIEYTYFDMTQPWPDLNTEYNYIIFPESLTVIDKQHSTTYRHQATMNREISNLLNGRPAAHPEFFETLLETDAPGVTTRYNVIRRATNHLTRPGQIRISSGVNKVEEAYLRHKQGHNGIRYARNDGALWIHYQRD